MPHTLAELAALAGVSPRTVRFYVAQGLLRGPDATGPAARYDDDHLARLRLIRRLQMQHLPLAEIRRRLDGLSDDQVASLAGAPPEGVRPAGSALDYIRGLLEPRPSASMRPAAPQPPMPGVASRTEGVPPLGAGALQPHVAETLIAPGQAPARPVDPPTRPPERSQWERLALAPDIELHVRRPLSRQQNKRVERLVAMARELLEEEGS